MPTAPTIIDSPLSYAGRLPPRALATIELVILHCTELPDLATAREYGERIRYPETRTGASGHYYVDRDGSLHRFVPDGRSAHHCFGRNERSIGIEIVNSGRYPDWQDSRCQEFREAYAPAQIAALLALLQHLRGELPALRAIAGHEDLDRRLEPASDDASILLPRRRDPGPLFPWPQVVPACGLTRIRD